MFPRILVVCVGNICRSPTAEIVFRHYRPGLSVSSAGLRALSGQPMDATARSVLEAHGLDGSHHTARQLHGELLAQADLILAMEQAHVEAIVRDTPDAAERTYVLNQGHNPADIPDPFGAERPTFEAVYETIDAAVKAWLPRLDTG